MSAPFTPLAIKGVRIQGGALSGAPEAIAALTPSDLEALRLDAVREARAYGYGKLTELELDIHNFERGRCSKPLRPFEVCVKSDGVTTTERVEATSWFAPWCDALDKHGLGARIEVKPA